MPDPHNYTMGLHEVNENKALTVLGNLNHEAYHYHDVILQLEQMGLR